MSEVNSQLSDEADQALRERVQRLVDARGGRVVAAGASLAPDTLYRFLRGEEPRAGTRTKLSDYADAADTSVAPPPVLPPAEGDTVPVSRETLGYLRGKLETTVAWLGTVEAQMGALGSSVHAVGETLTALRATLDTATSGVSGLLTDGTIPRPGPRGREDLSDIPEEMRENFRRIYAAVDREIAAAREASTPPAAKRAGGG